MLLVVLTCIPPTLKAQQPAPLKFKVEYRFVHIVDKEIPDTLHNENLTLRVSEKASFYSRDRFSTVFTPREILPPPPPGTITVRGLPSAVVYDWGISIEELYFDFAKNELKTIASISSKDFIIPTNFPTIQWKLTEETKEIGGYPCQKALGSFAGRNYTAWFTNVIPTKAGPWKLQGLPGLIVEAYDDQEEIYFLFSQLKPAEEKELDMQEFSNPPIEVSRKEYEKTYQGYLDNPTAFLQALHQINNTIGLYFIDKKGKSFQKEDAQKKIGREKENCLYHF